VGVDGVDSGADAPGHLDEFGEEYNTLRPHEALAMKTPACLWKPSPRVWHAEPPEWEYPVSMKVMRLNAKRGDPMAGTALDHQRRPARSTGGHGFNRRTGADLLLQNPAPRTGSQLGQRRDIADQSARCCGR
jgi:hypothetical protein